jgi:hypothetical protein
MVFVVILFWSCCLLLTYVYVLYPALVTLRYLQGERMVTWTPIR